MSVDCALITAIPKELDKLRFHFRDSKPISDGLRTYFETMSPNGLALVGAVSQGMGQLNAAALVMDVVSKYKPKTIILVGIAGGMDKSIGLGDVVISNQIVDYELGKVTPEGLDTRWSVYPVDSTLSNKAQSYRSSSWVDYIRTPRPATGNTEKEPSSHIGLYLSGNKVIASEKAAGVLRSFWKRAAAIEMEAAGIAAILRQTKNPPGFLVIKSICDYADSKKNDEWQMYSADAAASFAYSFVIDQLNPQDFVWPHRPAESNTTIAGVDFRGLRVALTEAYDLSGLKVLCTDLGEDWDEVAGIRKSEKIADLLLLFKRRKKLPALISLVNQDNDNLLAAYVK
jgi:nucleoside phosphorylase